MSAILRIVECSFSPLREELVLSVDMIHPDGALEDRTFLVIARPDEISTEEKLYTYVENDIASQREAAPNWVGKSWRSTRV